MVLHNQGLIMEFTETYSAFQDGSSWIGVQTQSPLEQKCFATEPNGSSRPFSPASRHKHYNRKGRGKKKCILEREGCEREIILKILTMPFEPISWSQFLERQFLDLHPCHGSSRRSSGLKRMPTYVCTCGERSRFMKSLFLIFFFWPKRKLAQIVLNKTLIQANLLRKIKPSVSSQTRRV